MKLDGTPHIALDILTGSNAEDGPLTTGLRDADPPAISGHAILLKCRMFQVYTTSAFARSAHLRMSAS